MRVCGVAVQGGALVCRAVAADALPMSPGRSFPFGIAMFPAT